MLRLAFITLLLAVTPGQAARGATIATSAQPIAGGPAVDAQAPRANAAITPLDRLQVSVFREPELSAEEVQVDESGRILLPLVGAMTASGKTSEALAAEISARLRQYIRNPVVAVTVKQAAIRRVTVTGSVVQPGVYSIEGRTTLLQAVALARGPSHVASTNQTLIFRTVNGQRTAAKFNLDVIARGNAPDPEVLPGDTIAIGSSKFKTAWRDVVMSLRSFNIFNVIP